MVEDIVYTKTGRKQRVPKIFMVRNLARLLESRSI